MQEFIASIESAIIAATGLEPGSFSLESPRKAELGDFAFPCFLLAKRDKGNPAQIAGKLAEQLNASLEGIQATATGPYINFQIDRSDLARSLLGSIRSQGALYGNSEEGRGQTVVIDLSSPNIAKPMSVGHLRSTVIGAAIQRLHDALGYQTVGINHIGDWGSQFGKLVAAVDRWGGEVDLESDPIKALLELYVRYHNEEATDPSLQDAARAAFQELESGKEGHVRAVWRRLTELSMQEFQRTYERLHVHFDEIRGESFYEDHLGPIIERIVQSGVTEESEGALIVSLKEFGENVPPCLLRKSDGTTLYATRDLAAAFHRWELYHFARCLYVVGGDQRLHFQQLKYVLQRMGVEWEPKVEHIAFGMMRLPEGKMSTRKGQVVFLEDVLDRAVAEAAKIIAEKNPELANSAEVAEQVGVGAVIFNDLKRERVKDIEFVWSEVLSFEGDTGPYVQYTHARLLSILTKADAGAIDAAPDWSALADSAGLLLTLGQFPGVIRKAATHAEPSEVTQYLLGLAREINSWIAANRVLGQAPGVMAARLQLADAARIVLHKGLALLGVSAPESM
ncbi:MAG: arginine--tRNA ligase [Planctomycetes bacterium]|nr:arginine--tRNA ligase [Planctomycetota bacterium]MCB9911924.1 arginine--tRNA ligase [Planctomycetota bacterium]HPF14804.1 arginine--tRNA ligase [Planctomycetota bacterium]HRV81706.1 arginine--tRNA ligase [Planctomycetota bacterium]